jgi:hypothetical protein
MNLTLGPDDIFLLVAIGKKGKQTRYVGRFMEPELSVPQKENPEL